MKFPMTLDKTNRTITGLVIAAVIPCLATGALSVQGRANVIGLTVVTTAFVVAWALAPKGMEITRDQVRILRRAAPPVRISADEIVAIEERQSPFGHRAVRVFGVGGLFGSYGLFWMKGFGRYKLYATRSGPTLVLRRRTEPPVLVTPDDPRGARQALEALVTRAAA
jgi:hypothetical protein